MKVGMIGLGRMGEGMSRRLMLLVMKFMDLKQCPCCFTV